MECRTLITRVLQIPWCPNYVPFCVIRWMNQKLNWTSGSGDGQPHRRLNYTAHKDLQIHQHTISFVFSSNESLYLSVSECNIHIFVPFVILFNLSHHRPSLLCFIQFVWYPKPFIWYSRYQWPGFCVHLITFAQYLCSHLLKLQLQCGDVISVLAHQKQQKTVVDKSDLDFVLNLSYILKQKWDRFFLSQIYSAISLCLLNLFANHVWIS